MKIKIFAVLLVFLYILGLCGCKKEERVNIINDLADSEYVNIYGRYYYDDVNNHLVLPNIASGIEVRFYGTELHAVMAKGIAIKTIQGYNTLFSVLLDGSINTEERSFVLRSQFDEDITLVGGLNKDWHTLRILKKDASNKSLMFISSVSTDGYFEKAPAKPDVKIMVYGDSITEGALMKSDVSMSLDVRNDGLSTYIMRPVLELGYDIDVFARDGAVLVCEWENEPGKSVLLNYDKICYDLKNREWDMKKFIPDVIVIYLGTNDRAACAEGNYTEADFNSAYKSFIQKLADLYGDKVKFILCRGAMRDFSLDDVIAEFAAGLLDVRLVEFPACVGGANSIGHPLSAEHAVYAEQMKSALLSVLNN